MSKQKKNGAFKNASEMLLAILTCGAERTEYTSGKIQRIVFLIDTEAGEKVGGPFFNFKPEAMGPQDKELYTKLNELVRDGYIKPVRSSQFRSYEVSHDGFEFGKKLLKGIDPTTVKYMKKVVDWAISHNFVEVVHAILNSYPELKRYSPFG